MYKIFVMYITNVHPPSMYLCIHIILQNPNSTISSIQLSLRLDYILTQRSTHPPPPHKLNLYTQNWEELTTAQLARRASLYKCTGIHRPV